MGRYRSEVSRVDAAIQAAGSKDLGNPENETIRNFEQVKSVSQLTSLVGSA
jgi:hypothetical protein